MFEISKYKKSNVKISIRLPENMNDTLKRIREFDSFKSKKSLKALRMLIFLVKFLYFYWRIVWYCDIIQISQRRTWNALIFSKIKEYNTILYNTIL